MKILVVGLNHKTAPVDVRERLAFNSEQTQKALEMLKGRFSDAEFALISTCNRVELYGVISYSEMVNKGVVAEFLSEFHGVPLEEFQDHLYTYEDADAVRHLLTVTSSLDSMVVGEDQIVGQVKESYRLACSMATGKILNRLFHSAFFTSKKVSTTTGISSGRVSVAGVAVELVLQLFAKPSSAKVVVVGAGEMGELLVQHLLQIGCKDITIINRSYDKGLEKAKRYGVAGRRWEELDEQLLSADIVIATASVQDYLFKKDSFKKIIKKRHKDALLVIDIAVPRNFEPSVNEIEDVYLYSIDELSEVAEQNRKAREEDITKGMQIVCEQTDIFMDWYRARDIGPLIGKMKARFAEITQSELEKFFVGCREDASCRDVATTMVKRIVNKLLHCVIKNVDVVAKKHGAAEAVKLVDHIVQQAKEISLESNSDEEDRES